ncbi:hypothetical protein M378DRAFT_170983 [Amanita muscaria Koide BX008]|uniref:Uncharacterized protein n=1 Tax=Amanita muscaria (strain Koide BX008) TaxID=946122 RepID=A0A0C2S5T6_AMAMK|nr:hypothetical protein M378DRAFT_170983 [Amanita muscaria Koide BX008]
MVCPMRLQTPFIDTRTATSADEVQEQCSESRGKRKQGHTNIANSRGSTSILAPATPLPKSAYFYPIIADVPSRS